MKHNIRLALGLADGAWTALIQHLFQGECLAQGGLQCKEVVTGERWPQLVGIKLIDVVVDWVDNGQLSTRELQYICESLELVESDTRRRCSLLSKLVSCR